MKFVSITEGFITNSSSVVHHVPKSIAEHPKVKAFIEKMELDKGYVPRQVWDRRNCDGVIVNEEQVKRVNDDHGWDCGSINVEIKADDAMVVIYGDEYESAAHTISRIVREVAYELGIDSGEKDYFN